MRFTRPSGMSESKNLERAPTTTPTIAKISGLSITRSNTRMETLQ